MLEVQSKSEVALTAIKRFPFSQEMKKNPNIQDKHILSFQELVKSLVEDFKSDSLTEFDASMSVAKALQKRSLFFVQLIKDHTAHKKTDKRKTFLLNLVELHNDEAHKIILKSI